MTFTTKHQRLAELRPLSPAAVRSLVDAWDVRMVSQRLNEELDLWLEALTEK